LTFWDSSALVAMITGEPEAQALLPLLSSDPLIALWWSAEVEATSAISRAWRAGVIDEGAVPRLLKKMADLIAEASQVEPSDEVKATACRLLRVHELRAADALHLAAAVIWANRHPANVGFVCLDRRLRTAAAREGFNVLPG